MGWNIFCLVELASCKNIFFKALNSCLKKFIFDIKEHTCLSSLAKDKQVSPLLTILYSAVWNDHVLPYGAKVHDAETSK